MLSWASKQFTSICTLIICLTTTSVFGQHLRISTFNIRWYGLDSYGDTVRDKWRDKNLRETMDDELEHSDVMVFQEIVDVGRFQRNVIRGRMECRTYYHSSSKHQHVVICYQHKYTFERADGDNNYIIEETTEGTSKGRPALYGLLKYRGRSVAYVVGVHLKAFPDESSIRLRQTYAIARRLRQLGDDIPIIITGDFNTYEAEDTPYNKDDHRLMSDIYKKYHLPLYEIYSPFRYTYLSKHGHNKFDRFWVSYGVDAEGRMDISKLCASGESLSENQIDWLNENVSDHCMVSVDLDLP